MAVKTSWSSGDVLTAADLTDTFAAKWNAVVAASAPSSPSDGDVWIDTSGATPAAKMWDGSAWSSFSARATYSSSTGSPSVTTPGGKTCVQFTGDGTVTTGADGYVEMLLVAGGGGSGNDAGAGAGGLLHKSVWLPAGTHTVKVGAGGAGGSSGLPGGYTRCGPYAVPGGGAGQNAANTDSYGGSAGGGGRNQTGSPWAYGYASFGGAYGNNADGGTSAPTGGGGGGAGAASSASAGGAGLSIEITGSAIEYAHGGDGMGGANYNTDVATSKANLGWGANGSARPGASGVVILLFG